MNTFPKKGAWIMVIKFIPTVIPVQPYTIYYAKPVEKMVQFPMLADLLGSNDTEEEDIDAALENRPTRSGYRKQVYANIKTPFGDVMLKEEEYSVLSKDNFSHYLNDTRNGTFIMHFYAETTKGRFKAQSKKLTDSVFYCRTRGISLVDAILMCTGIVTSQNVFFLEAHPAVLNTFYRKEEINSFLAKKAAFIEKREDYDEEGDPEFTTYNPEEHEKESIL